MEPVHLAFLWHQHQPLYKDLIRGHYVLPWVRLHAIKDYLGMLLVLKEFPRIRCTINMVPSLVLQISEYADGTAEDDSLRVTRKPASDLTRADRRHMAELFFAGNPPRLIRPFPRYSELLDKRNHAKESGREPLSDFAVEELRDTQVWATLAWFHPLVVESDGVLAELRRKGRGFTEEDKAAMLERQQAVLRRVLPMHREMAERGQIEVSTTPFYHPILPLLCNPECAREALPDVPMPETRSDFRPDAKVQLDRAFALHEKVFGAPPKGMWPAEGAVGMDILPLLQGRGLKWIATDEGILARSMSGVNLSRDWSAVLHEPDALYQPYALPGDGLPAIVFRDHGLADAIGFEYHHGPDAPGAENFVWRVEESGRRCHGRPRLVSVILDGENPWDYYGNAGLDFLRETYRRLTDSSEIVTTTLADYVEQRPPQRRIERLAAGSWINADFYIWIGHADDRKAWSLVAAAREALLRRQSEDPPLNPQTLAEAWEHIYIAEGSDWCWWLGPDHTADLDYLFDRLFRSHLANVYSLIGALPPDALGRPIGKTPHAPPWTMPAGILNVTPDGQVAGPEEWAAAGRCDAMEEAGTMARAVSGLLTTVFFGHSRDHFCLRLDAAGDFRERLGENVRIQARFINPRTLLLLCDRIGRRNLSFRLLDDKGQFIDEPQSIAAGRVLELTCPLRQIAARSGDAIEFFVEVFQEGALLQRVPPEGAIRFQVQL